MYYFLKNKNFNLEQYDFDVSCHPRLTLREHALFDELIGNNSFENDFSVIELSKLKYSNKDIYATIQSLSKKFIFCQVTHKEEEISRFYFSIFDIVVFEKNKIIYKFSKEINMVNGTGNFFSRISLISFLRFKMPYTKYIFNLVLKKNKCQGTFDYSLNDFKKLINISSEKYLRYYDLEQKILNPLIKDIKIANIIISFDKIKKDDSKTSKISGIRLNFINIYHSEIHKSTNSILRRFAENINDFSKAYQVIYDYRKIYNETETITYLNENFKSLKL